MFLFLKQKKDHLLFLTCSRLLIFLLSFSLVFSPTIGQAQTILNLPVPGTMVTPSPPFAPVLLKGMTIHPDNPLKFDFIVDSGNTSHSTEFIKQEAERLIKYFLASMTIPKDDLWVNLSPYESDRIIPNQLGRTELGRDMLAQDYLLKQLTASLLYPEEELGEEFWQRIYEKLENIRHQQGVDGEISHNFSEIVRTFNKVWILPEKASVYEHDQTVYVVNSRLKVMLDADYISMSNQRGMEMLKASATSTAEPNINREDVTSQEIIREMILPEIEREVNEGKNFAPLRQIYHSLILAKWYKETIKESLLSKVYIDQNKTAGVDVDDPAIKEKIYNQYMEAYKKGVFNYIKEDYDRLSQEVIPRKYFSGGINRLMNVKFDRTEGLNALYNSIGTNDKFGIEVAVVPQKNGSSLDIAASPIDFDEEISNIYRWHRTTQWEKLDEFQEIDSEDGRALKQILERMKLLTPKGKYYLIGDVIANNVADAWKFYREGYGFNIEYIPEDNPVFIKGVKQHKGDPLLPHSPVTIILSNGEEYFLPHATAADTFYRPEKQPDHIPDWLWKGLGISFFHFDLVRGSRDSIKVVRGKKLNEDGSLNSKDIEHMLKVIEGVVDQTSVNDTFAHRHLIKLEGKINKHNFNLFLNPKLLELVLFFLDGSWEGGEQEERRWDALFEELEKEKRSPSGWHDDEGMGLLMSQDGNKEIATKLFQELRKFVSMKQIVTIIGEERFEEIVQKLKRPRTGFHSKGHEWTGHEFGNDFAGWGEEYPDRNIYRLDDNQPQKDELRTFIRNIFENIVLDESDLSRHQNYLFTPDVDEFETEDGLIFVLKNNKARLEYVIRTGGGKKVAEEDTRPNDKKDVALPHGPTSKKGKCVFCNIKEESYLKTVTFGGHNYSLIVNPNPWAYEHFMLISREKAPQIVRKQDIWASLAMVRELGEKYEGLFNSVEAAASVYHFHIQFHKGLAAIWNNLDEGRIREAKESIYNDGKTQIVSLQDWPAKAILFRSDDGDAISTHIDNLVRIFEKLVYPYNIMFRFANGKYEVIVFPRSLDHERPTTLNSDTNSWSRFGGMEMSGILLLLSNAGFEEMSQDHALAETQYKNALNEMTVTDDEYKKILDMFNSYLSLGPKNEGKSFNIFKRRYEQETSETKALSEFTEALLTQSENLTTPRRFLTQAGKLLPRVIRRENGTFGIAEAHFLNYTETKRKMVVFLKELKEEFGDKLYTVNPGMIHMTTQGLEVQWDDKNLGTTKPLTEHSDRNKIDINKEPLASALDRAGSIDTKPFKVQVAGLNWHYAGGIFWEIRPYMEAGQDIDAISNRRNQWGLPAKRAPHITAAYFAQPFSAEDLKRLQEFLEKYPVGYFGDLEVDQLEVAAYEDYSFNSGMRTLKTIKLDDGSSSPVDLSINPQAVEKIKIAAVEELHRFLRFVNDPAFDEEYLAERIPQRALALVNDEVEVIAQEFANNPEAFTVEKLVANGEAMIPTHSARIEIDTVEDATVRQIFIRGISVAFADIVKKHLTDKLKDYGIVIGHSGESTFDFRTYEVDKASAIEYLEYNFDSILDQMNYSGGDIIDSRETGTVIVVDGDDTIWKKPAVGDSPSLKESESYESIVNYLTAGGILMVSTGNLFERTKERIEADGGIPQALRNRVIIATSGGAAFYVYDKDGQLKEVDGYQYRYNLENNEDNKRALDLIYIGDDERQTGNDYSSFNKAGFLNSFLVSNISPENLQPNMREIHIGNHVKGTVDIIDAVVRLARDERRKKIRSVFAGNAVKRVKEEIIRGNFKFIEDQVDVPVSVLSQSGKNAVEVLTKAGHVVLIESEGGEGEYKSQKIIQKLLADPSVKSGYSIDLSNFNLSDTVTLYLILKIVEDLVPEHGKKLALHINDLEALLSSDSAVLRTIMDHPNVLLVGVTDFEGYREFEKYTALVSDMNFIITQPEIDKTKEELRILIVGASAFLGETMFDMFKDRTVDKANVLGTAFRENEKFDHLDVTDPKEIEEYFKTHEVDVVIYVAGEADADKTKKDLPRARALNAGVVEHIHKNFNGKFVYISTEYIFDGKNETAPYTSHSQRNPLNEYGLTKAEGEDITLNEFDDAIILRPGVLYGYNHPDDKNHYAKVVLQKLINGEDIEADDIQLKRPVIIEDVALTAMKLIDHDVSGIFQINGYEPMTKYDEAKAIADVYYEEYPEARRVRITPLKTEYLAPRPLNTFMINSDTPRSFREGVREMLFQMSAQENVEPKYDQHANVRTENETPDSSENLVLRKVQYDIRHGFLRPDNIDDYNRVSGEMEPFDQAARLPMPNSPEYKALIQRGSALRDAVGFSMGGLSTRFGSFMRLGHRFVLKEIDSIGHSILEWKLGNVRHYNATHDLDKPVLIMTSQATHQSYEKIRKTMDNFDLAESGFFDFDNGIQRRLLWEPRDIRFGEVALQSDGTAISNPPGHYAFIRQAVVSGQLAELKKRGVDFIYHSNMSNFGAIVNEEYDAIRGYFALEIEEARRNDRSVPMTLVEVVKNTGHITGSFPISVDGKLRFLRTGMFNRELEQSEIPYYNTANYHFYIDAILERLGFDIDYVDHLSKEEIARRFDLTFNVKPQVSEKIFIDKTNKSGARIRTLQIERNLDDFVTMAPAVVLEVSDLRHIRARSEDGYRNKKKQIAYVLNGQVDMRYGPYRLESIDKSDQRHAVTSFIEFRDEIRQQPWGGHWIEMMKRLDWNDESVGSESIEASSHPDFPSIMFLKSGNRMVVTDVERFGFANEFFGERVVEEFGPRIPFMLKFLDAQRALSIQVHPNDKQARNIEGSFDEFGKEEAFFIVNAEEDNEMVLGLKEGISEEEFRRAVKDQDPAIEDMLHRITVSPGDVYRIPFGKVHAFQRGIQVIELGHMSDLTYRLYDYNRKEKLPAEYEERNVHIDKSLRVVNLDMPREDEFLQYFSPQWEDVEVLENNAGVIQTVDIAPEFHADRFMFSGLGEHKGEVIDRTTVDNNTGDRFHVLMAVKGSVLLRRKADDKTFVLEAGNTVYIPADLGEYEITTNNDLQSIVYRFYPKFPEEYKRVNIGISLGGTKFIFGVVDEKGRVYQNEEFDWSKHFKDRAITPVNIERVIMKEIDRLLTRFGFRPEQVNEIGIAFPGPINYEKQLLTATYLPFNNYPLAKRIEERFATHYDHTVKARALLDVLADVKGEMNHEKGGLVGQTNGMVLNIATGIALGILKDGEILDSAVYKPNTNEEFVIKTGLPQIGKHLTRPKAHSTSWEYHPTSDGSNPEFSKDYERLSKLLGGPYIARRYIDLLISSLGEDHTYVVSGRSLLPLREVALRLQNREGNEENVALEKRVLINLTKTAYEGDRLAGDFIEMIGEEMGAALATFIKSYPDIFNTNEEVWRLVLVGSIGEKFGNPQTLSEHHQYDEDLFLESFNKALADRNINNVRIMRSRVEEDGIRSREIIAFKDVSQESASPIKEFIPGTLEWDLSMTRHDDEIKRINAAKRLAARGDLRGEDILYHAFLDGWNVLNLIMELKGKRANEIDNVLRMLKKKAPEVKSEKTFLEILPLAVLNKANNIEFDVMYTKPSWGKRKKMTLDAGSIAIFGFATPIEGKEYEDYLIPEKLELVRKEGSEGSVVESGSPVKSTEFGGIDMNDIEVEREGSGVNIHFTPTDLNRLINMDIDGFAPVIINITPLPSILPLLGLEPRREDEIKVSSIQ